MIDILDALAAAAFIVGFLYGLAGATLHKSWRGIIGLILFAVAAVFIYYSSTNDAGTTALYSIALGVLIWKVIEIAIAYAIGYWWGWLFRWTTADYVRHVYQHSTAPATLEEEVATTARLNARQETIPHSNVRQEPTFR